MKPGKINVDQSSMFSDYFIHFCHPLLSSTLCLIVDWINQISLGGTLLLNFSPLNFLLKFLSEFNTDPWIIHCHVQVMRNPQGFLDKTSKSRYGLFGKSRNPSWLISEKITQKCLTVKNTKSMNTFLLKTYVN